MSAATCSFVTSGTNVSLAFTVAAVAAAAPALPDALLDIIRRITTTDAEHINGIDDGIDDDDADDDLVEQAIV